MRFLRLAIAGLVLLFCLQGLALADAPVPKRKPTPNMVVVPAANNTLDVTQMQRGTNAPIPKRKPTYYAGTTPDVTPIVRVPNVRVIEADGNSPITIPGLSPKDAPSAPSRFAQDEQGISDTVVVFFQENAMDLEPGQSLVLDQDVAAVLQRNDRLRVTITAYAEKSGGAALSEKRAQGLGAYIARKGIDTSRIYLNAQGADTDISPRDRAEFTFRSR